MEIQGGADFCFPHISNTSCKKPEPPSVKVLVIYVMLSLIALLSVILNMLVIISISHFRQLHTPTNILLLSMAVSDFLVGLLLTPGQILRTTLCWFLGNLLCSLYKFVIVIISCASVGDMVLISIDRYVAICDALRYTTRVTLRRAKFCVFLCWLCSALYGGVMVKDDFTIPDSHNTCYGECVLTVDNIIGLFDILLSFIAPVTIIFVLYMRVFVVAVSHARAMRSRVTAVTLQHSVAASRRKSELKAARTLGVMVIVFLVCFCPYYGISLAGNDIVTRSYEVVAFVMLLYFFNSCINPVIYALFYPWFRKTAKLIVTLEILQPGSHEANIL